MSIDVDIQIACEQAQLPSDEQLALWVETALAGHQEEAELTIRIVEEAESQQLNDVYRGKNKPTNVLSFPFEVPEGIELSLLGDLVICASVVEAEAKQQNKLLFDHWAHMVIHGVLHLLAYDHIQEQDAEQMEALERQLLRSLGISDPYQEQV